MREPGLRRAAKDGEAAVKGLKQGRGLLRRARSARPRVRLMQEARRLIVAWAIAGKSVLQVMAWRA